MELSSLIRPDLVFPNVAGRSASALLLELAGRLADLGIVASAGELYDRLQEREALGSTALGHGVAVPHCKLDKLDEVVMALATSSEGIDFGAEDGEKVRVFFVVLSPTKKSAEHLQSLAAISRWLKAEGDLKKVVEGESPEEIVAALRGSGGDGA